MRLWRDKRSPQDEIGSEKERQGLGRPGKGENEADFLQLSVETPFIRGDRHMTLWT